MIRRFRSRIALLGALALVVCAFALPAPPAAFASAAQVIADCNAHARLTRTYSIADLREALATMSADVKEYTDCPDVIERALLAALSKKGEDGTPVSSQSSSSSFLPTPLIIVIVVLALAAATFAALAIRRRREGGGGPGTGGSGPTGPAT